MFVFPGTMGNIGSSAFLKLIEKVSYNTLETVFEGRNIRGGPRETDNHMYEATSFKPLVMEPSDILQIPSRSTIHTIPQAAATYDLFRMDDMAAFITGNLQMVDSAAGLQPDSRVIKGSPGPYVPIQNSHMAEGILDINVIVVGDGDRSQVVRSFTRVRSDYRSSIQTPRFSCGAW